MAVAAGVQSGGIRVLIPLGLLAAEILAATVFFDTRNLLGKPGLLTALIEGWAPRILQSAIVFSLAFAALVYVRQRERISAILHEAAGAPVRVWILAAHLAAAGASFAAARVLFSPDSATPASPDWFGILCVVLALAQTVLAFAPFLPLRLLIGLVQAGGAGAWIYAAAAAALVETSALWIQRLWAPATALTFSIVQSILTALMRDPVLADPAAATIGTARFSVTIARQCSGLEGAGLFLALGSIGLLAFRQDFRFPRAFLLLPVGVGILYLFNAVRIAVLIGIGHSGAPGIAEGGFHSQAGWISFNAVSLGLFAWARASAFFSRASAGPAVDDDVDAERLAREVQGFLLPFLTILATGMLVRAVTADFEWLYPVKLFAAAGILWLYRDAYGRIDWRFGWPAVVAGAAVLALWVGLDFLSGGQPERGMPQALASASGGVRGFWLACRVLAAVVTVPIAEELAFRGYLMRRFAAVDFTAVDLRRFHWTGFLVSSVLFGCLHGDRWLAGILAGIIYGAVAVRTGRLGDAIAAHALTNLALAAIVLTQGAWRYW